MKPATASGPGPDARTLVLVAPLGATRTSAQR
jgi:hypothetical protein